MTRRPSVPRYFWLLIVSSFALLAVAQADRILPLIRGAEGPGRAISEKKGAARAQQNRKAEREREFQREKSGSAGRITRTGVQRVAVPIASGALGRSSVAINDANQILFTKTFPGTACGAEFRNAPPWTASTAFSTGRIVKPTAGQFRGLLFQATTGGTSGATEPAWPTTVGATVTDGTVVWTAIAFPPIAREHRTATAYATGAFVHPNGPTTGFLYEATTGGTTGGTAPVFPTTVGATVTDGTVVWTTRATVAGTFVGCDPMQLVVRTSTGTETTIATEGQSIPGGMQLAGWGEFYDLNNAGVAAFKAAIAGLVFTAETGSGADESGTGLFTAGVSSPLTNLIQTGTVVGGRTLCGIGTLVSINDAGQVGFEGFSPNASNACDEEVNGIFRFTPGTGVEFLFGTGSAVPGGGTVLEFSATQINALGHFAAHANLSDGDDAVYLVTGPGAVTEVARTGSPSPLGGVFDRAGQAEINDLDQIVFKAATGGDGNPVTDDGVDTLFLFTPGTGSQKIAAVGEDIGVVAGGAPTGVTFGGFAAYRDINNNGDVAFIAALLPGTTEGIFLYNRPTGVVCEVARTGATFTGPFSAEANGVALNDAKAVAFFDASEVLYLYTTSAGVQTLLRVNDSLDGTPVTSIFHQPQIFDRQLNASCSVITTAFTEGDTPSGENLNDQRLFALFNTACPASTGCGGVVPTATPTPTGPLPPTSTPTTTPITGAAPVVPTLSLPMMILLGLALAGVAFLVLRKV